MLCTIIFSNTQRFSRKSVRSTECVWKPQTFSQLQSQVNKAVKNYNKKRSHDHLKKRNPEDFILKASKLINEQKASLVIEKITYNKIEGKFEKDIFTNSITRGSLDKNAIETKKHIYDHLITDSKVERKFAEELEGHKEVSVYAKLPKGFLINTPVGNYNPDWAIVFNEKAIKYVYFIAETKGSLDSLELREVEKAKIECAKKHFSTISDNTVKYDVVDSYESLLTLVM